MIARKILIAALVLLAMPAMAESPRIDAPEAWRRAQDGALSIIDIGSPGEWRQTGIPKGAKAVTIHDPEGMDAFLRKVLAAVGGDRSKPVAVICAAGGRSTRAAAFLRENGFTNVTNIVEGMLGRGDRPGWLARRLPTERSGRAGRTE